MGHAGQAGKRVVKDKHLAIAEGTVSPPPDEMNPLILVDGSSSQESVLLDYFLRNNWINLQMAFTIWEDRHDRIKNHVELSLRKRCMRSSQAIVWDKQ